MTKKNLKPQQAAPVQREIKGNQQYHFLGYVAPTTTNLTMETILLRATMRNSPLDSNTHLKKCQKSFSNCQGARLASTN